MSQLGSRAQMVPTAAGQALLGTFSRIRIINLRHRADRRREIAAQLRRLQLEVDGGRIAFHDACRPDDAGTFPSVGARGCFTSHLDVLEEALADGAETLLILEDDMDFVRDAEERIAAMMRDLSRVEWSLFYGGYECAHMPDASGGSIVRADPDVAVGTTHFVALSRQAIEIAVPYLKQLAARPPGHPDGGPMHVDGAYSWLRRSHPQLQTWLAEPQIGRQRPSRTDIAPLGFVDRAFGLRHIAGGLRRLTRVLRNG